MKIAVIGGIGSGKSLVIKCLKELGERTCDCDEIYKEIVESEEYIRQIDEYFGVVKEGRIDKVALGNIIFNDNIKRAKLNALAHPLIFDKVDKIYSQDLSNLYVEVSAFDLSMAKYFDAIVYVSSNEAKRIDRIKARNGYSEDYILSIMSSQLDDEQMQSVADFVIVNDGSVDELSKQVEYIIAFNAF